MILKNTDEIMGALEKGELSKDFAEKIHEVLEKLAELDSGSGSVTLKLKFSSKAEMVSIKSSVEAVLPKKERRTSNFFMTPDGRLSLQHPAQVDIFAATRRDAVDAD